MGSGLFIDPGLEGLGPEGVRNKQSFVIGLVPVGSARRLLGILSSQKWTGKRHVREWLGTMSRGTCAKALLCMNTVNSSGIESMISHACAAAFCPELQPWSVKRKPVLRTAQRPV